MHLGKKTGVFLLVFCYNGHPFFKIVNKFKVFYHGRRVATHKET